VDLGERRTDTPAVLACHAALAKHFAVNPREERERPAGVLGRLVPDARERRSNGHPARREPSNELELGTGTRSSLLFVEAPEKNLASRKNDAKVGIYGAERKCFDALDVDAIGSAESSCVADFEWCQECHSPATMARHERYGKARPRRLAPTRAGS
jgi:hypothetical protein